MARATNDRNLLFGILAFQNELVSKDDLITAMNAWILAKERPLADIFVEQGKLSQDDRSLLDQLIDRQVQRHGSEEASLNAVELTTTVQQIMIKVPDLEISGIFSNHSTNTHDETTMFRPKPVEPGMRYRVLRKHAEGGLGEVFVAEDLELHREIALKEMRSHVATQDSSRGRFMLEAEITGGLEHPGIVPVYGLGTHTDGRPFYAMRFIRGDNLKTAIHRFHQKKPVRYDSIEFRQLLGRMIDVCNAIAYAHSRGVLHRDIKPGNIMLGKFGETLVVDWGLAKITGRSNHGSEEATLQPPSANSSSIHQTLAGNVVGTPVYMSPEQADGRIHSLSGLTDVYSLGTTLYVLLTNRLPFHAENNSEILQKVRQGDVEPPRKLFPAIPANLEAICLKAMALKPEDRYADPLELAKDLERWLADEAIVARRDPFPVRTFRWAKKHRTAVVTTSFVFFTAFILSVLSAGLLYEEQKKTLVEKNNATEAFELTKELSLDGFKLVNLAQNQFAEFPAADEYRKKLFVNAAKSLRRFIELEPTNYPLVIRCAEVDRFAANMHRLHDEYEDAIGYYRHGIASLDTLPNTDKETLENRILSMELMKDYSLTLVKMGKLKEARELAEKRLETARNLPPESKNSLNQKAVIASSQRNLASIELSLGNFTNARILCRESQNQYRSALGFGEQTALTLNSMHLLFGAAGAGLYTFRIAEDPNQALLHFATINREGICARELGDLVTARSFHAEATVGLANIEPLLAGRVTNRDFTFFFYSMFNGRNRTNFLSLLEEAKANPKGARSSANLELNLQICQRKFAEMVKASPAILPYRVGLAEVYILRGELKLSQGKLPEAESELLLAKEAITPAYQQRPKSPEYGYMFGDVLYHLGNVQGAKKNAEKAKGFYEESLSVLEATQVVSPDDWFIQRKLKMVQANLR
jgi:eukaryotic-like serine/threonine-protein kinase